MFIISHRGNLNGPNKELENKPEQIDKALSLGFDVELDVRIKDGKLFLGHDEPQYEINIDFLTQRKDKLWIHCKDAESLEVIKDLNLNFFYHTDEDYVLTSKNFIWVYPGKKLLKDSIYVMPSQTENGIKEVDTNIVNCEGVCTDFPYYFSI